MKRKLDRCITRNLNPKKLRNIWDFLHPCLRNFVATVVDLNTPKQVHGLSFMKFRILTHGWRLACAAILPTMPSSGIVHREILQLIAFYWFVGFTSWIKGFRKKPIGVANQRTWAANLEWGSGSKNLSGRATEPTINRKGSGSLGPGPTAQPRKSKIFNLDKSPNYESASNDYNCSWWCNVWN